MRKYALYKIDFLNALHDKRMHKLLVILYGNTVLGVRNIGSYFSILSYVSQLLLRLHVEGYADYHYWGRKKIYYLTKKGIEVLKEIGGSK